MVTTMKISGKNAIIASVALIFLFLMVLLIFFVDHQNPGVQPSKQVSESALMTGRDNPDSRYIELIPGQQIDINTADKRTLQQLPGIGDELSRRIIDHREQIGSFHSIEDIMLVEGIDEGSFDKIKNIISIGVEHEDTGS